MTDVVPRKRPWELHVIVCLFALALGYAVSSQGVETTHQVILGGLIVSLIGLFRGNRFAWWTTSTAFLILVLMTLRQSGEMLQHYGWRIHPKLLKIHGTTLLALVSFFLLVLCWFRGAIPAKAAPLLDELPAVGRFLAVVAPLFFIVAGFFSLATVVLFESEQRSGDRSSSSTFKALSSAEADFRANDRDGNKINDFWTADVRGLWSIVPENDKEPIKLIAPSFAAADSNPAVTLSPPVQAEIWPKGGYWYSALIEDRSEMPVVRYGVRNTSKFGFIAYPNDRVTGGQYAFILNENNTIFRHQLKDNLRPSMNYPPGPLKDPTFTGWPSDEDLKAYWNKLD